MVKKHNSPMWAYLTVLLAAMVGLAMTPAVAQAGAAGAGASQGQSDQGAGQQGAQPSEQPGASQGTTPGQNPSGESPSTQSPNNQGQMGAMGQQNQSQGAQITATGCLQKAASGNGYQLTDTSSMKTYELTPASSDVKLSDNVGHTVTVTGTASQESASATAGEQPGAAQPGATNPAGEAGAAGQANQANNGAAAGQNQQLNVTNLQSVSDSCQAGQ